MVILLLSLIASIFLIHYYLKKNNDYWKKRNVPGPEPKLIFGNVKDIILFKTTVGEGIQEIYNKFKGHPVIGIYELNKPVLLLIDPKLIKQLLIKDFSHFPGRISDFIFKIIYLIIKFEMLLRSWFCIR